MKRPSNSQFELIHLLWFGAMTLAVYLGPRPFSLPTGMVFLLGFWAIERMRAVAHPDEVRIGTVSSRFSMAKADREPDDPTWTSRAIGVLAAIVVGCAIAALLGPLMWEWLAGA